MKTKKWVFYLLVSTVFFLPSTKIVAYSITENLLLSAEEDSLTLLEIYNATDGENWLNTWDLDQPIDTWHGIVTDITGCVTEIDLSSNGLVGSIPVEIGNLSKLRGLNMGFNQLTNTIPSEIGQLDSLINIFLGDNQLTGSLPAEIGNLQNLLYFGINNNQISGEIPTEFGNLEQLLGLYLGGNELTGSLPAEIGNLTQLRTLRIGGNQITGTIPVEMGNLTLLDTLYAQENMLSGSLPIAFFNLTNLKICVLNNNLLIGEIPEEIGDLTELQTLGLQNNDLSGTIPASIENTNLSRLQLQNNSLSGEIPSELGNLINLNFLKLNNNSFSGNLPIALANLVNLETLSLNGNLFEGCFPSSYSVFCDTDYSFFNNPLLINNGDFAAFCSDNIGSCDMVSNLRPGDANNDGIVNMLDVFTLAYKNGTSGLTRDEQSIEWTAIPSIDWVNTLPDGRDGKYADTDGNGIIEIENDMLAVEMNFDSTHQEGFPVPNINFTANNLVLKPLSVNYIDDDYEINYQVNFNNPNGGANALYGFTFILNYDSLATFTGLDFSNSSLSNDVADLYEFSHNNSPEQNTEVALVKTNNLNTTDLITLADFIIVEDNIPSVGNGGVELTIFNVIMTDNMGNYSKATDDIAELFITEDTTNGEDEENLLAMTIEGAESDCNGGRAEVLPLGATPPYTYNWGNGQTDAIATNLALGNQTVTVTDANIVPKEVIGSVEITGVSPIEIAYSTMDAGNGTGSIEITNLSGGDGDLTIAWENGQTGTTIDDLPLGNYTVMITDTTGCVYTEVIELLLTSTVEVTDNSTVDCVIYPNPVADYLQISLHNLPSSPSFELLIANDAGQIISSETIENLGAKSEMQLNKDVQQLASGSYLLYLKIADRVVLTTPFVK